MTCYYCDDIQPYKIRFNKKNSSERVRGILELDEVAEKMKEKDNIRHKLEYGEFMRVKLN